MNKNSNKMRNLIIYISIPLIVLALVIGYMALQPKKEPKYSEIVHYFQVGDVKEYSLDLGSGALKLTLKGNDAPDGTDAITYSAPSVELLLKDITPYVDAYNVDNPDNQMVVDYAKPSDNSWLLSLLPTLILIGGLVFAWFFILRRMGGGMGDPTGKKGSFGKTKIKNISEDKNKTTFKDVAGADEEKAELEEIVNFLKEPKQYDELGARIPKGVLLMGPPGTGKTLLARAVAGEAGVPFFSMSGSDFVEMFVGMGASRVRDLFDQAKKNAPCIVFIDEIDAVGRQRGAGMGGGNDEREQTLNQLLVEMDGFGANEGVIMIAATNRPDVLDPALMRPGRFDRQVVVGYPDMRGREAILKVHARGKPLAPNVDLKTIAKTTAGFTGADLSNLLNESALLAARKHLKAITMDEIKEATIKVVVGAEKKSRVISDKEKKLTAYHEAGHAITAHICVTQDPVHQISIIPAGMAGGYTMQLPTEDRSYKSRTEMKEELLVLLGGRVSEALVLKEISTGASNDIERATKIVRAMITKYGMNDLLGPIVYGSSESEPFLGREMGHVRDYSEETASEIDSELRKTMEQAYAGTTKILTEHMDKLHEVAKYLFEHEKMSADEFVLIMDEVKSGAQMEAEKNLQEAEVVTPPADVSDDSAPVIE